MTRKNDLEQLIRDAYRIICEFEDILQFTENPLEKRRSQSKVMERWELIHGYLVEYQALCKGLGLDVPQDIREIIITSERTDKHVGGSKISATVRVNDQQIDLVPEVSQQGFLIKLYQTLVKRFDEEELRTLCFYLNANCNLDADYDNLPGEGKEGKVRELIKYLDRRDQIASLAQVGKNLRVDVPWDELINSRKARQT